MDRSWLDDQGLRLTARCPLPLDAPFTPALAQDLGVSRETLRHLVRSGMVRPVLRGVYVAMQAPDTMLLRARCLGLVLPEAAVVTDRTAAWLHGVDILPRTARAVAPPVQAFFTTDTRMDRPGVSSGRRDLLPSDITVVHGIRVTTALRTALDLGRLLWRFDALAAIDGFLRMGVPQELLLAEIGRFKGFRGVVQLRALAPLGDPRAESVAESALRLHWYDAGLRRPELQVWVYDDRGVGIYRLDIADEDRLFAAEYDGEENHTAEVDRDHDEERREWCTRERGWSFEVFTKVDVYGPLAYPVPRLAAGWNAARKSVLWTP
jgi:hypothetical protein